VQIGGAAIYHKHPLVVVNATGNATAHDVMGLLRAARQKVYRITGLEVIPEPNFIGFNEEELQYYLGLEETSSS
jgi:UDP-N-acetylenolpyruvoylglucosamine reductase